MQRRRLTWVFVLAGIAVFGASACDDVDYEKFEATLDGAQEVPPVSTGAAGKAVLLISRDGSRADLTLTLTSPLTGTFSAAHIHKNARGVNGGIVHNIWVQNVTANEPFGVGTPIGRTLTFSAQDLADLRAGLYYVNVHSSFRPGGEIRGQLERK